MTGAGRRRSGARRCFLAARAEDGRGDETVLVELVRSRTSVPRRSRTSAPTSTTAGVLELSARLSSRRRSSTRPPGRRGRLRARRSACDGDRRCSSSRTLRDLGSTEADVVLGGGMLARRGRALSTSSPSALPARRAPVVPARAAGARRCARRARRRGRERRGEGRACVRGRSRRAAEVRVFADADELGRDARGEMLVDAAARRSSAARAAAACARPIARSPRRASLGRRPW